MQMSTSSARNFNYSMRYRKSGVHFRAVQIFHVARVPYVAAGSARRDGLRATRYTVARTRRSLRSAEARQAQPLIS